MPEKRLKPSASGFWKRNGDSKKKMRGDERRERERERRHMREMSECRWRF